MLGGVAALAANALNMTKPKSIEQINPAISHAQMSGCGHLLHPEWRSGSSKFCMGREIMPSFVIDP